MDLTCPGSEFFRSTVAQQKRDERHQSACQSLEYDAQHSKVALWFGTSVVDRSNKSQKVEETGICLEYVHIDERLWEGWIFLTKSK